MRLLRCDNCKVEHEIIAELETDPATVPSGWYRLARCGWLPDFENRSRAEILLCSPSCLKAFISGLSDLGSRQ